MRQYSIFTNMYLVMIIWRKIQHVFLSVGYQSGWNKAHHGLKHNSGYKCQWLSHNYGLTMDWKKRGNAKFHEFMTIWQYKGLSLISTNCSTKVEKGVTSYHLARGNRTRELVSHPQPRPPRALRSGTLTFCQLAQHITHCWLHFIFFTFSFPVTCT